MGSNKSSPLLSTLTDWWDTWGRWALTAVLLSASGLAHVAIGGLLIAQTNQTDAHILGSDQKHNIKLTLQTVPDLKLDLSAGISEPMKKWFPHRTDGVVNPLWPWVSAWLASPRHVISASDTVTNDDRVLFHRGRWFNVGLTAGFIVLVGIACARTFHLLAACNVVLLCSLGALLPRAVYYQPESLYFVFFFLTWVACLFALLNNSLWIYGLVGLFSGIAYLAKGSVHPLLLVFIGVSSLRWIWGWITSYWPSSDDTTQWVTRNHWFGLALLGFVHLLVIAPRLSHAHERFGDPLHSFPSYWMWFDRFEDCYAWMNQYGNRKALESIRPSDKPSFSNYAASHSREEMIERLKSGVQVKLGDLFAPPQTQQNRQKNKPWKGLLETRGWYLGGLAALLGGVALVGWASSRRKVDRDFKPHPEASSVVLFVLGGFVVYTLAYGWYTPIGRGDRFMLSLYAPLVLSLTWGAESLMRRIGRRGHAQVLAITYQGAHLALFATLVWRLLEIYQHPVFKG